VPLMLSDVNAAILSTGTSAALALARAPPSLAPSARSILVLSSAVSSYRGSGGVPAQAAQLASTGPTDSVRRAADGIGKSREGRDIAAELAKLARESGASATAGSAFRQAVHVAELHATLGADVNLLLHQEKLGAAPVQVT
jgi:hypothetical protein